jgi:predicted Zn-dependent peptidase
VAPPQARLPIQRFTLDNGLRVVLSPDTSAPAVGIAVYYDVGFRSEPEGRTGFAHLFEHLMFQGTVNLERGEADKLIESNGGQHNASTHPDFTAYIEQLPSNALELGLFIEASRMGGARFDDTSLRNQIDVVKEEIKVNVLNRPYGGFPWMILPGVMFETFNNAHNGYGSFVDIEAATVEDAADFFERYYAPGNAVLAVAGDFSVASATDLVENHFGPIRKRRVPRRPSLAEPPPGVERRAQHPDHLAPMSASVIAYRVPDPIKSFPEFLAASVLGDVLGEGEPSRLYQMLVKDRRIAVDVAVIIGPFGNPLEMRDPTMLQFIVFHPGVPLDAVLEAVDSCVASVIADGVSASEVDRVVTSNASAHLRQLDNVLQRAMVMGLFEQQRGQAELVNTLPSLLGAVTPAAVQTAARRWLSGPGRAILEVVPG